MEFTPAFENQVAKAIVTSKTSSFTNDIFQILTARANSEYAVEFIEISKTLTDFIKRIHWNETSPTKSSEVTELIEALKNSRGD